MKQNGSLDAAIRFAISIRNEHVKKSENRTEGTDEKILGNNK